MEVRMAEPRREGEPRRSGWLWIWIVAFVVAVLVVLLWALPARQPPAPAPAEDATVSLVTVPAAEGPARRGK
jgi:hypothetical protein